MGERKAKWQNDYIARSYDRINMFLPKGQKDLVKAAAVARGQSVNAYIVSALAAFGAFDGSALGDGDGAGAPAPGGDPAGGDPAGGDPAGGDPASEK